MRQKKKGRIRKTEKKQKKTNIKRNKGKLTGRSLRDFTQEKIEQKRTTKNRREIGQKIT